MRFLKLLSVLVALSLLGAAVVTAQDGGRPTAKKKNAGSNSDKYLHGTKSAPVFLDREPQPAVQGDAGP